MKNINKYIVAGSTIMYINNINAGKKFVDIALYGLNVDLDVNELFKMDDFSFINSFTSEPICEKDNFSKVKNKECILETIPRFYTSKNPGTVAHVLGFSYISDDKEIITRGRNIDELAKFDVCSILDEIAGTGKVIKIYCYIEKIKPSSVTSTTGSTPQLTGESDESDGNDDDSVEKDLTAEGPFSAKIPTEESGSKGEIGSTEKSTLVGLDSKKVEDITKKPETDSTPTGDSDSKKLGDLTKEPETDSTPTGELETGKKVPTPVETSSTPESHKDGSTTTPPATGSGSTSDSSSNSGSSSGGSKNTKKGGCKCSGK